MRYALLCIILVIGLSSPAFCQQLKEITNSIGMKFVFISAGTFKMGAPAGDVGSFNAKQHLVAKKREVTLTKSYYLGVYEVTQDEYEKVMGNNPSKFRGEKNPIEMMSWIDAVSFCKKVSEIPEEKAAGREYRLPTEAEWEYACRAGSTTSFSYGDTAESLGEYAWFNENLEAMTHPVGEKKPNRWGLYDMHGNVNEWCQDLHEASYPKGPATDPQGPTIGSFHVLRGGDWRSIPAYCTSTHRSTFVPTSGSPHNGFRVAMSLSAKQPETTSSK